MVPGAIPQGEADATSFELIEEPSLKKEVIAEVFGTCTLVQIGCAGLCVDLYLGALKGMWQIGVIWALGAMMAILATASISGGHLNPAVRIIYIVVCTPLVSGMHTGRFDTKSMPFLTNAQVTLSFALVRREEFSWKRVIPYWVAQLIGAMLAGLINLLIFHRAIRRYEKDYALTRGHSSSIQSAAAFGNYWRYVVSTLISTYLVQ